MTSRITSFFAVASLATVAACGGYDPPEEAEPGEGATIRWNLATNLATVAEPG